MFNEFGGPLQPSDEVRSALHPPPTPTAINLRPRPLAKNGHSACPPPEGPEQVDAFSSRSSAKESACAAEESLFDPSRKPPPLAKNGHSDRSRPRFFFSFVRERVGLRGGGISLRSLAQAISIYLPPRSRSHLQRALKISCPRRPLLLCSCRSRGLNLL
jgi:hypothetical protein